MKAELLHGQFQNFTYDVHSHETACFALLTAGQIRIRMRGTEFVARQGDMYAIDADEAHAGWPIDDSGWHLRTLYVGSQDLLSSLGAKASSRTTTRIEGPIIRDPKVARLMQELHSNSENGGPRLSRDRVYLHFVEALAQRYMKGVSVPSGGGQEPRAVRAARELLDENLNDQVSLLELAAQSDVTPFVLLRAFERSVGMTPHAYQRQARVRWAMQLLRTGHTVSDASVVAGFSDQAHCTRWFRRILGVTPGQYRAAMYAGKASRLQ